MNRRSFLSMMGFMAPAVIVKPTYFLAPRDGWGIKIYSTIGQYANYRSFSDAYLITEIDTEFLSEQMAYRMGRTIDILFATQQAN